MCGIVGLYLKNHQLVDKIGEMFAPMLVCMTDRGQDSAGLAIYGDEVADGWVKFTAQHPDPAYNWQQLVDQLSETFHADVKLLVNHTYAIIKVAADEAVVRTWLTQEHPEVRIMSAGRSIEIMKEMGSPQQIVEQFGVDRMKGTHVIGHTRMATESRVSTEGSHPFSTGLDICLVHNGSLSNHNRLRRNLQREGIVISTQNDSEVAAGYLQWRMQQGDTLESALESALRDLDGFYTLAIGTRDGFAVLRDPIACKPAVMAETDDYVAIASEYQALASLPGIEEAKLWEPEPGRVYTWGAAS